MIFKNLGTRLRMTPGVRCTFTGGVFNIIKTEIGYEFYCPNGKKFLFCNLNAQIVEEKIMGSPCGGKCFEKFNFEAVDWENIKNYLKNE